MGRNRALIGSARIELAATLRSQYESGLSVRDISTATGRSYGAVHRLLRDAGTTFRERGRSSSRDSASSVGSLSSRSRRTGL
ncbi:helix-turn-helix domain-containing protein [Streptomyces sp. NPDC087908]|uniref:helix-turn-helix domain-containing protein n=1 Tax=Streptomyces sp. NPDC087908 TaxID=3365820 RepID=UPI003812E4FD